MTDTMLRDAVISFPMLGNLTLNPSASFTLFGHTFYWYGVILAISFLAVLFWCVTHAHHFGLKKDDIYDEAIWVIIFGVIGCRIYYVIFQWDYYSQHLSEIYRIWDGGVGMYGGIIAGFITVAVWSRLKKIKFGAVLDCDASGMLIGHSIGRWGNFINREAFGVETTIFCRMGLTVPGKETIYVHPTFLYESIWTLIGFILINIWGKKGHRNYDGQMFMIYIMWYGLGRSLIEGLRTDSLWLIPGAIRVSQMVGILSFISMAVTLIIESKKKHPAEKLFVNQINKPQPVTNNE